LQERPCSDKGMAWQIIAAFVLTICAILAMLRCFAAEIYDAVIVWMTSKWYAAVFQKLQDGDRILDIGIGTATALVKNKAALLERHLSVVGIDYEAAYVRKAEAVLKTADLWRTFPLGRRVIEKVNSIVVCLSDPYMMRTLDCFVMTVALIPAKAEVIAQHVQASPTNCASMLLISQAH